MHVSRRKLLTSCRHRLNSSAGRGGPLALMKSTIKRLVCLTRVLPATPYRDNTGPTHRVACRRQAVEEFAASHDLDVEGFLQRRSPEQARRGFLDRRQWFDQGVDAIAGTFPDLGSCRSCCLADREGQGQEILLGASAAANKEVHSGRAARTRLSGASRALYEKAQSNRRSSE